MRFWLAIACFLVALSGLGHAIKTEYAQSRDEGPIAIVPTLPFGIGAALLLSMGSAMAWPELGPLPVVGIFLGTAVAGLAAIRLASKRNDGEFP